MKRPRTPPQSRSRFARLYSDGGIGVAAPGTDFETARRQLIESHDDPTVELLEIEITVLRSHGKPKLQAVTEHSATCPTCGETVYLEVPHG